MVYVSRSRNPLGPGEKTRESLQRAVELAEQQANARAEQAQNQKEVQQVQWMIQRAGDLAKQHAVRREIQEKTITYTTNWVRHPHLSTAGEETQFQLLATYTASRVFAGIPIKPTLSSVQMHSRLYDTYKDVPSEHFEQPLLFTWSEDDPKILYNAPADSAALPDETNDGTLVRPDTTLFYQVRQSLKIFEDLKKS